MSAEQNRINADRVASSAWVLSALFSGWLALLFGLGAATITVASGAYAGVLRAAIVSTVLAVALLIFAFWRGGVIVRISSAVGLVPILFIGSELLRRSPFGFGP